MEFGAIENRDVSESGFVVETRHALSLQQNPSQIKSN
jgi:hypothetical protein